MVIYCKYFIMYLNILVQMFTKFAPIGCRLVRFHENILEQVMLVS